MSREVRGILNQFPNIGKEIETFVQDSSVGADAWRRTGILTFDGNTRVKSKVTYEGILLKHTSVPSLLAQLCNSA